MLSILLNCQLCLHFQIDRYLNAIYTTFIAIKYQKLKSGLGITCEIIFVKRIEVFEFIRNRKAQNSCFKKLIFISFIIFHILQKFITNSEYDLNTNVLKPILKNKIDLKKKIILESSLKSVIIDPLLIKCLFVMIKIINTFSMSKSHSENIYSETNFS